MESTAEIPLVGGPADGTAITVELDANGRPPLTHHHIAKHGMADADMYELETVTGDGLWRYRWRRTAS